MHTNISLTGISKRNELSLLGYDRNSSVYVEPFYITKIKKRVFELYVIPLQQNNWNAVNQNMFTYDIILNKLNKYYKNTPSNDLFMYIELLKIIAELNGEYRKFGEDYKDTGSGLAKFEEVLPTIRLAPAYELYILLRGRPENNIYDDFKIARINELLNDENITFEDIKNEISF
jgi:hypothetical protein